MFSVQFRKEFAIFSRQTGDSKISESLDLFGLKDHLITECLDDLILVYEKEHLAKRRDQIVKELDSGNLSKDQVSELEQELNDIVIELAKMK